MHTVEINNKSILFASKLDELSQSEYLYLLELVLQQQEQNLSMDEFRTLFVCRLLRIRKTARYYLRSDEHKFLIHENILALGATIDSFFETTIIEGVEKKILKLDTFKNLIPSYDGLIGPADALTNCTFFVYKEAFNYFLSYTTDHNIADLHRLIATLYRPRISYQYFRKHQVKWDGSYQQPYTPDSNPEIFNKRVAQVANWPTHVKSGIELYFSACVEYIRTGRPVVDGIEMDMSIMYSGKTEPGPSGIGITGLLFSLAESKVFGSIYETANTNLYDVLVRLYQLKLDYDYQMSKYKKS